MFTFTYSKGARVVVKLLIFKVLPKKGKRRKMKKTITHEN